MIGKWLDAVPPFERMPYCDAVKEIDGRDCDKSVMVSNSKIPKKPQRFAPLLDAVL